MKSNVYILEIYEPNSMEQVWKYFEASSPFLGINSGDLLNPFGWEGSHSPVKILRIVNLEHMIWETETEVKHKLLVYTEEVDGSEEIKFSHKK
jgi:hypothetical protein